MKNKIKEISIQQTASIVSAIKQMDETKHKLLLVLNQERFYSLLSIGDVQRAIIANIAMEDPISKILRPEVYVAKISDNKEQIKARMLERRNDFMPIIDDEKRVVDVIFWSDLFDSKHKGKMHS